MRIYLDHNATTPVRAEVVDAMTEVLRGGFGNPSSTHAEGASARSMIERARAQVAAGLGAQPTEVIFTGGATESNNTVLRGVVGTALERGERPHLIISTVEHPSVLEPCERLEEQGARVTRLEVDGDGLIDLDALDAALAIEDTALLSLIWANNETGVLQPMAEISELAHRHGALVHCDAVQAVGKIPVDIKAWGVDYLALSGHKIGGPQGIGALVRCGDAPLSSFITGGGQEHGGLRVDLDPLQTVVGILGLRPYQVLLDAPE